MNSYKVIPYRRPAYVITGICFFCGCLLLFSPLFGQKRYAAITQTLAVAFYIAALLVTNRYLLTKYLYEIESEPNPLSALPKLNIYGSGGHNFGHQFYCVPFEKTYKIEKKSKKEKLGFHTVNCCGSMYPRSVYLVTYDCDGQMHGVFLECDSIFAGEIEKMITRFGLQAGEQHEEDPL